MYRVVTGKVTISEHSEGLVAAVVVDQFEVAHCEVGGFVVDEIGVVEDIVGENDIVEGVVD